MEQTRSRTDQHDRFALHALDIRPEHRMQVGKDVAFRHARRPLTGTPGHRDARKAPEDCPT